jgi:hypothetical protein
VRLPAAGSWVSGSCAAAAWSAKMWSARAGLLATWPPWLPWPPARTHPRHFTPHARVPAATATASQAQAHALSRRVRYARCSRHETLAIGRSDALVSRWSSCSRPRRQAQPSQCALHNPTTRPPCGTLVATCLVGGFLLGLLGGGLGLLLGGGLSFDALGLRSGRFVRRLLLSPRCTRTAEISLHYHIS